LTFNVVPIAEVEEMDITNFDTMTPLN
jgi:hypothetical protein